MGKPVDTIEEMVEKEGWTVGYEPTYGSGWTWLNNNQNPAIKTMMTMMEVSQGIQIYLSMIENILVVFYQYRHFS